MKQSKRISPIMIHWIFVFLWVGGIFAFSAQPAVESNDFSLEVTYAIVKAAVHVLPIDADEKTVTGLAVKLNGFVRKCAHGTIYFILGMVAAKTFIVSGMREKRACLLALLFCFLYAVFDEFHQLFVPGRGGQVSDIIIDACGAALGIGLYLLLRRKLYFGHH